MATKIFHSTLKFFVGFVTIVLNASTVTVVNVMISVMQTASKNTHQLMLLTYFFITFLNQSGSITRLQLQM